jgi:4-diphosphocytidyl-2-C-methyl-D-erythritol kinase
VTVLTLRAHAKINLSLQVLGRRPDGYHEISTVVQTISLCDSIEISRGSPELRLEVDDPILPAGPGNLVFQAAGRLLPLLPAGDHPAIRLRKRVPQGAGLGGGSSDAACTLAGIDRLYRLGLGRADLRWHAAEIGSDVPFFLEGGTALLQGRGTEVRSLPDLPPRHLVIASPGRPLSTALVYAQLQESLTLAPGPGTMPPFGRLPVDLEAWVRSGNDLEPYATRLCPEIADLRAMLGRAGATAVSMTGSGSAVYGAFVDAASARDAAENVEKAGFKAFLCRTLDRGGFLRERMEQ